jgi:hypothetical protein
MRSLSVLALLLVSAFTATAQQNFLQTELTPGAGAKMALGILFEQGTVSVPEWGSGRSGLVKRAEFLSAGWAARATTEYSIAAVRGTDTGYRNCECKGFPKRAAHALKSGFIEYRTDGTPAFAVARFSGLLAGAVAPMPMLPAGYGFRDAAQRSVTTFGVDEGFNMLIEFRKEIVRTLLFRKN